MKSIGLTLVLFGGGSFVLQMMDREFTLLMWIDNWGPAVGTAVRVGMIVVGAGLWFFARSRESAAG